MRVFFGFSYREERIDDGRVDGGCAYYGRVIDIPQFGADGVLEKFPPTERSPALYLTRPDSM